ncbi:CcoQ/FixQ family Cbb3-type cytochrome c oxidase assembly chaperone [Lentiprolixibacter aurantiacus]|uniref:CcoQ/FixQ family Cbb3-type cytochrome c oxidase assembly chaperone n=1 Tax=Lentiprolixibacter aurantiacus TaxID=2993939 RepID=A0AAE3SMU9_9FLAO|nr:CcoQ/FixQ family Cbb3-type cytochrome c oxidase assembly chaperone [Lentiprolixibacter aurantiacus]MCX2718949.1 CcoQ/FixQ family Cbb3-type cytochrome c oxidase assembly chaperone [Lentiprolixibacter aurantiacus]
MLKFIKNHMESIDGIATYPIISLTIFFVFFAILFWWVMTTSKERIKELSELPLDDNQPKP